MSGIDENNKVKLLPSRLSIAGIDKKLESMIDNFVGNYHIKDINRSAYRRKWEEFLPEQKYNSEKGMSEVYKEPWSIDYVPQVAIRKVYSNEKGEYSSIEDIPYLVMILNSARDNRPKVAIDSKEDSLQKNVIDKEMIMAELDTFYLCPNGFPYSYYASLLIHKNKARVQGKVESTDIEEWIKLSFLTDQYVFFNSVGAGASQPNRFHAQVIDPEAFRSEGKPIIYPIKKAPFRQVKNGVYQLEKYPIEALKFVGKLAPYEAARLTDALEDKGLSYNVVVDQTDVMVFGRNRNRETSHCMSKKVGSLECMGVMLVGNVEEKALEQAGLYHVIHGTEVFNEMTYQTAANNIGAASLPKGWLRELLYP
ncbi:MAG TPA: hypothetical protein VJK51_03835 [Candidatus Nanoarchaeia archaeon]|nr:hypothetical protein [Candidatus Nanoarchaeia archaeon]